MTEGERYMRMTVGELRQVIREEVVRSLREGGSVNDKFFSLDNVLGIFPEDVALKVDEDLGTMGNDIPGHVVFPLIVNALHHFGYNSQENGELFDELKALAADGFLRPTTLVLK